MNLRARLREPQALLATFAIIPSAEVVELVGAAGFDVVIIDMEHGPHSVATLPPSILAARAWGVTPIVRVRDVDPWLIGAVLDAGAAGVLVPQVESAETAEAIVAAARFAPSGKRGVNPWVRAAGFDGAPDWPARANDEVAVIVMLEGRTALDRGGEILAVEGIDAIFLGPVDLASSLGLPGQPDHPTVVEAIESVIDKAQSAGVATAVFARTSEIARHWVQRGVDLVAVGEDTALLLDALREILRRTRDSD